MPMLSHRLARELQDLVKARYALAVHGPLNETLSRLLAEREDKLRQLDEQPWDLGDPASDVTYETLGQGGYLRRALPALDEQADD